MWSRRLERGIQFVKLFVELAKRQAIASIQTAQLKMHLKGRRQNTALITASAISGLILLFAILCAIISGFVAFFVAALLGLLFSLWLPKIAPRFFPRFASSQTQGSVRRMSFLSMYTHELCMRADIEIPDLLLCESKQHFACCLPSGPAQYFIILSTFLVDNLDDDELVAVLAHEVSHIEQNDAAWRMTLVGLTGVLSRAVKPLGAALIHLVPSATLLRGTLREHMLASTQGWDDRRSAGTKTSDSGCEAISRSERLFRRLLRWALLLCLLIPYGLVMIILSCGVLLYMPALLSTSLAFVVARTQELVADDGGALLTLNPLALASALEKVHSLQAGAPKFSFSEALLNLDNARIDLDWDDEFAEWIVNSSNDVREMCRGLLCSHPPVKKRIERLRAMKPYCAE